MTWNESVDASSRAPIREGVESVAPRESKPSPEARDAASTMDVSLMEDQARKLQLLEELLQMRRPVLRPELSPLAPLGHAVPRADELFGVPPGHSLDGLEELADLGLLSRQLHNQVHVCPSCRCCQINFREHCPLCRSIDLELESLIQHFRCAYSGVESEFTQGFDLVCPKCRRELIQHGQDFDRPTKAYVCRDCKGISEEADLEIQCLHCAREFNSTQVEVAKVYRYRPTLLTLRAVELGRLSGLDVSEVMFDSQVGLATREFLTLQSRRELDRLTRHGAPFSTVVLSFRTHGSLYPIFREWPALDLRNLGQSVVGSLRTLDLVSRIGNSRIGILLPETNEAGLAAVRGRFTAKLRALSMSTRTGQPLDLCWADRAWEEPETPLEAVLEFFEGDSEEEWQIRTGGDEDEADDEELALLLEAPHLAGQQPVEPMSFEEEEWEDGFDPRGFEDAATAPLDDGGFGAGLDEDDLGDFDDGGAEELGEVLDTFDDLIERAENLDEEESFEPVPVAPGPVLVEDLPEDEYEGYDAEGLAQAMAPLDDSVGGEFDEDDDWCAAAPEVRDDGLLDVFDDLIERADRRSKQGTPRETAEGES